MSFVYGNRIGFKQFFWFSSQLLDARLLEAHKKKKEDEEIERQRFIYILILSFSNCVKEIISRNAGFLLVFVNVSNLFLQSLLSDTVILSSTYLKILKTLAVYI